MNDNNNGIIRLKAVRIIFLGDSNVGKTNLMNAYDSIAFNPDYTPTYYMDKITVNYRFEDNDYKIIITDFPHRFKNGISAYLRSARIIVLIFDMTKKDSFLCLSEYLDIIYETVGKNANLILVGNKSDLSDKWKIKEKDAKKFAEAINAKFFLSSAKDGRSEFIQFLNKCVEDFIRNLDGQFRPNQPIPNNLINDNMRRRERVTCWI